MRLDKIVLFDPGQRLAASRKRNLERAYGDIMQRRDKHARRFGYEVISPSGEPRPKPLCPAFSPSDDE